MDIEDSNLHFDSENVPGIVKRSEELEKSEAKWYLAQQVFLNENEIQKTPGMFSGVNMSNPMEFKAYEKASLAQLGMSAMKTSKFSSALLGGSPSVTNAITNIIAKQGPKCKIAALASVAVFAAGTVAGKGILDKTLQFSGFVADAAQKLGNIGTIDSVSTPIDDLDSPECAGLTSKTGAQFDAIATQLGNYLTPDQQAMMKSWLCWPTAMLLKTSAETLKTFDKEQAVAESMVFWNYLDTYFPFVNLVQNAPMQQAADPIAVKIMNDFVAASISTFQEAGATKIATAEEHNGWVRDAAASLCQALSHGISVAGKVQVLPAQMAGAVVVTNMTRQLMKLNQATVEDRYSSPW